MLVLLTLLTAGYFATVVWIVRGSAEARRDGQAAEQVAGGDLPVDDQPPASAVGWPPGGRQFTPTSTRASRRWTPTSPRASPT